jgi:hypothetical protein
MVSCLHVGNSVVIWYNSCHCPGKLSSHSTGAILSLSSLWSDPLGSLCSACCQLLFYNIYVVFLL